MTNTERRDAIRANFARQGMMITLGARLVHLGEGTVSIEADITEAVGQQQGFAHAGLAFSLGDSASGYAAMMVAKDVTDVVTAEMKINLLAPAVGTHLRAEGRVIRAGRSLIVTAADVYACAETGEERHIATLLGTMVPIRA